VVPLDEMFATAVSFVALHMLHLITRPPPTSLRLWLTPGTVTVYSFATLPREITAKSVPETAGVVYSLPAVVGTTAMTNQLKKKKSYYPCNRLWRTSTAVDLDFLDPEPLLFY
jgi:hypothetical protein